MSTTIPVTVGGWYEEIDGGVAECRWRSGNLVRVRQVSSWSEVPDGPSWAAPLPSVEKIA